METTNRKTILVTGSEGWVGGNLVPRLEKEYDVKRYDLKLGRDINDVGGLVSCLNGVSVILHLAGMRGPDCDLNGATVDDYKSIHEGTKSVVEACEKAGVKRLIYLSTGAVYGTKLFDKEPGQQTPNGYIRQEMPYPITDDTPYCDNPHPYSYWKGVSSDYVAEHGGTVFYVNDLGSPNGEWKISFNNIAMAVKLAIEKDVPGKFNIADEGCSVDISKADKLLGYKG